MTQDAYVEVPGPAGTMLQRVADGAIIPRDPDNADYAAFLAAGGVAAPYVLPPPAAADVRAEASRRMQALLGARDADHLAVIISNAQRESARLYAIRLGIPGVVAGRDWTEAEAQRAAELYMADQAIEAIRAASNAMEAAPPADYTADSHWP